MYSYICALFVLMFCVIKRSHGNSAPSFTPPSSPIIVSENEVSQVSLYRLTVTDNGGDTVTCTIPSSDPSTSYFDMVRVGNGKWNGNGNGGGKGNFLYLLSGSSLDFDTTPVYNLTVDCSDGSLSSYGNIKVSITPNVPPTFTNLPGTSGNANANSVNIGDVVFTVTASDVDSTSLTYSMTSFPASPDLFEIDPVTGQIRTRMDLKNAVTRAYNLRVTVSDSKDSTTSNVIIPITNGNIAPIINNLPDTVYFPESTSSNTVLFTLSTSDPNAGDTLTITYSVTPTPYTFKFEMNGDDVRLANNELFNYEGQNTFTLTFTVSDGLATTTNADYVLNVNVVDVNTACRFEFGNYYVTMDEGSAGAVTVDPGYIVTDEDAGDTFVFFLHQVDDASYFTINQTTGVIGYRVDYDVDVTHANSTNFRVYCRDNFGNNDYANLYITIDDVNDNAPVFSEAGYIMYFDQTMAIPTNIGTLSASDADSGTNAIIDYTWTTTGTGSSYFRLLPSGLIIMQSDPRPYITYGDNYRFVVTATDNGSPAMSGTTTIDLIYVEVAVTTLSPLSTTTTVTTTTVYQPPTSDDKGFFDEPSNVACVVLGSILGLMLISLGVYLSVKYFKQYMEKSLTKKVEPKKTLNQSANNSKPIKYKPNPDREPFAFWSVPEGRGISTPPLSTKMDKSPATTTTFSF